MTSEASSRLEALGFSEYEARAYVELLKRGPLTGYQLAKASGIPRPNVYPVLDRLQERGAVSRIELNEVRQYVALPADEMLNRLGREAESRLAGARDAMESVDAAPEVAQVWNLQGYGVMLGRAREMRESAETRLRIGLWSSEARELATEIAAAESRGVAVTTLCIEGCPGECGGCHGEIYRYPVATEAGERWLVISADERELLVGQVSPSSAVAAVTRLGAFVAIGSHYLRNAIAAAEIVRSLGPTIDQMLDERATAALRGAGLASGDSSWLERMLAAARRSAV
jgi:predicted transcriptional regulator